MLQNPGQKAVFGQDSSSWSGELPGARWGPSPGQKYYIQFRVGLWSQGRNYYLWMILCKPNRRKLSRSKVIWPGPIIEAV